MTDKSTRRSFIKQTTAATAGLTLSSAIGAKRVLGANDRVRVAILGAGDRMMGSLVPAFLGLAPSMNFELVSVCDIWNKRREEVPPGIARKYNIKEPAKVRNTDELYAMKDLDAVVIATADFQHAYHAIEAVKAGKDTYCEKPFANIMSDANEALDVIGKSKQVFQVGTQRRSTPSYMRANEYLRSGKFGDIVMADMTWNVNQPGRWRRPAVVPATTYQLPSQPFPHFANRIPIGRDISSTVPPIPSMPGNTLSFDCSGRTPRGFRINGWFTRSIPSTGSPATIIRRALSPMVGSISGAMVARISTP